jgi:hypothetical protein
MRSFLCCAVVAVLFACCGCGPAPFWVQGLSLPSGSTVVSQTESTTVQGMGAMLPFKGKVEKVLNVNFDNPGGWSAVSAHIDSIMTRQGYTDQMASMAGMAGGMPPGASAMFSSMRMYSKDGAKYTVMLNDMGATMAAASQASGRSLPSGIPGTAGFMLMVIKTE